jgi:hypothetical protein
VTNRDYTINVKIRGESAQAEGAVRAVNRALRGTAADIQVVNRGSLLTKSSLLGIAGAATAAAGAATFFMSRYIAATIEAEKVQAQLQARLRDTNSIAGRSLAQLSAQASRLQKQTIFDDETIGQAQALLLTFTNIRGVNFDKTVESALDLSTVLGIDAPAAAKVLGRALNDPVRGLAALTKAGITFSDAEREKIRLLVESGQVTQAQNVILEKLQSTMGSAAEAARDTFGGAIQSLKNTVGNLLEGDTSNGGLRGTVETINELNDTLNDPSVKRGIDSLASGLLTIANEAIKAGTAVSNFINDAVASIQDLNFEAQFRSTELLVEQRKNLQVFSQVQSNKDSVAEAKRQIAEIDQILKQRGQQEASTFSRLRGLPEDFGLNVSPRAAETRSQEGSTGRKRTGATGGKTRGNDDQAAAQRRLDDLAREIALLDEVGTNEDRAAEAARIRFDITKGSFAKATPEIKAQLLAQAELLDQKRKDIEAEEERKEALARTTEAYEALREELQTPTEAALSDVTAQVKTLNAALNAGIIKAEQYDRDLGRVLSEAFDKAPQFQGLAPEVGGPFGELGKIDEARKGLEEWYQEQIDLLNSFRERKIGTQQQWDAQELLLQHEYNEAQRELQSAETQVMLAGAEFLFGNLADIAKTFGGEQSKTYQALFALSKAFAIAQAAVALANNVAEASKYGFPQNLPFIAGALAQGATIAGLIAQASFDGGGKFASGGHVRGPGTGTSDSIPTWLSNWEFVTRSAVVREPGALPFLTAFNKHGMAAIDAWNSGRFAGASLPDLSVPSLPRTNFAEGGLVQAAAAIRPQLNVRMINALDRDAIAEAMGESPAMEETFLNFVDRNAAFLRQRIG